MPFRSPDQLIVIGSQPAGNQGNLQGDSFVEPLGCFNLLAEAPYVVRVFKLKLVLSKVRHGLFLQKATAYSLVIFKHVRLYEQFPSFEAIFQVVWSLDRMHDELCVKLVLLERSEFQDPTRAILCLNGA